MRSTDVRLSRKSSQKNFQNIHRLFFLPCQAENSRKIKFVSALRTDDQRSKTGEGGRPWNNKQNSSKQFQTLLKPHPTFFFTLSANQCILELTSRNDGCLVQIFFLSIEFQTTE